MWARSLSLDMALIPLSLEQQLPGPSSLPPPTKRTATSDCLKSIFRTLFSGHPLPELWNADSGILLSHNCWSQGSGSWTCHWRPMRLRIPNGLEFFFLLVSLAVDFYVLALGTLGPLVTRPLLAGKPQNHLTRQHQSVSKAGQRWRGPVAGVPATL